MVTRSVEQFLAEAIESILGQTFGDFEFIIVDFGSRDKSKAISARYSATDNRIRLHEIPPCSVPEARNAGCALAQGRYIAIMDADDISLPDRLAWEVEFMEKHPGIGLLGGAAEWIDARGRPLWVAEFPTEDEQIKAMLRNFNPFCHSTVLLRTEAYARVLGYRAVFTQSHDYDLALRISEQFQCANLPQVVLKYRFHLQQVSITKRRQQTLCKLAAQASAVSRGTAHTDALAGVREITAAALVTLGVTEAMQRAQFAAEHEWWMGLMSKAGEYRLAFTASVAVWWTDRRADARSRIAEFQFDAAQFNWKNKRYGRALLAGWNATIVQPAMVGRFTRSLLWRLGIHIKEKERKRVSNPGDRPA
jgi:hypothetical protein